MEVRGLIHALTASPPLPVEQETGCTPGPLLTFGTREKSLTHPGPGRLLLRKVHSYEFLAFACLFYPVYSGLTDLQLVHVLPTVFLLCRTSWSLGTSVVTVPRIMSLT